MYGLPQAGRLGQLRLISHLSKHGYHQAVPHHSLSLSARNLGRYLLPSRR